MCDLQSVVWYLVMLVIAAAWMLPDFQRWRR
jgi:hypothetical protein